MVTPNLSSHASKLLLTTPSVPTTTGTTSRCLISWYLSIFSPYFSYTLWSQGEAISTMIALLFSFLTTTVSGLLASIKWSHCHIPQDLSFFVFHYPFRLMFIPLLTSAHVIQQSFQWTNLAINFSRVFSCTLSVPTSYTHLECDLLHLFHILQRGESTDSSMLT